MAWVGTNSTNVVVSQGGAADLMWAIKSSLLEAGWRLMSFGGGASSGVYQAPNQDGVTAVTDTLTTAASLNVKGAWFRIKEPGSTTAGREYIFQRGDAARELNIKYSRSSGFTGSHVVYTVGEEFSPTTDGGDGVSLFSTLTDSSVNASYGVTTTLASGRVHCVASSTANSAGVWEFFALSTSGTTTPVVVYQAGLIPGSYSSSDADPSFRGVGDVRAIFTTLFTTGDTVSFWNAYGTDSEGYVRGARVGQYYAYGGVSGNYAVGYSSAGAVGSAGQSSIYDDQTFLLPAGLVFSNDPSVYTWINIMAHKGMPANIHTFGASAVLGDTFNLDSENPKVVINTAYSIGLTFPWVRNITPVF